MKCHYKQLNPISTCRQEENVAFNKNKLIQYGQKHKFLVLSQHVGKNPRTHLINNKHVNWKNSVENKLANNYSHNHLLLSWRHCLLYPSRLNMNSTVNYFMNQENLFFMMWWIYYANNPPFWQHFGQIQQFHCHTTMLFSSEPHWTFKL